MMPPKLFVLALSVTLAITTVSPASIAATDVGLVRGLVWWDENGDGRRQQGEPVAANVPIVMRGGRTTQVLETLSASDGTYQFTGLEAGTYALEVVVGPGPRRYVTSPTRAVEGTAQIGFNIAAGDIREIDFGIYPDSKVPRIAGLVRIEDQPATSVPDVRALVDGKECSLPDPLRPPNAGAAFYHVAIFPVELVPGCGEPGKTIGFSINGRPTNESIEWSTLANVGTTLALTVGVNAGPADSSGVSGRVIRPPDTGNAGLR